ncbi:MAG: hypothetical protein ACRC4T_20455 [Cetobacterium sp.]
MKKIIIMSIMSIFILSGCGEKVETTSKEYKKTLLEKVYKKDEKSVKEFNEIKEKLEKQIENGKSEATKELDRWNEIEKDIKVKYMMELSEETQKIADEISKKGKLW